MGGDENSHFLSYTDDSVSEESSHSSVTSRGAPFFSGVPLGAKVDNGETGVGFEEFEEMVRRPISYQSEINRKRARNIYMEVLRSYDELQNSDVSLETAKLDVLGYTPGSWNEGAGDTKLSDYEVPKTTAILLIGTEGSGKSTLVNKITNVFETQGFKSHRAQVSFNGSTGGGTCFLQEYMIPRYSKPLCLYDTRSLSENSSENEEMLKQWMTEGVCHGEPVMRASDDESLKTRLEAYNEDSPVEVRPVSFVVFVVNAISVLESMDGGDETMKHSSEILSKAFNNPFVWFKDDKPAVVITHGDLLSLPDRARVRVHLGEMLGIHPKRQIFDIPESDDHATKLIILDMLQYCLDHADKNLPFTSSSEDTTKTNDSRYPLHIFLPLFIMLMLVILPVYIVSNVHSAGRRLPLATLVVVVMPLWFVFGHFLHSLCPMLTNLKEDFSSMHDAQDRYHAARDSSTESE